MQKVKAVVEVDVKLANKIRHLAGTQELSKAIPVALLTLVENVERSHGKLSGDQLISGVAKLSKS